MSTTKHHEFVAGISAMVAETRNKFAKEIEAELKKLPYDQREAPAGYMWVSRLCRQGAGPECEERNRQIVADASVLVPVGGGLRRKAAGPSVIDLEEVPQVTVTPEVAVAPVSKGMTYFEALGAIKVGGLRRQGAGAEGGDDNSYVADRCHGWCSYCDNEYPQPQHHDEEEASARIDAALDRESYLD